MAIPELKAFDCIDLDPIDQWVPDSDSDVFYSLCLHIGPASEKAADLFQVDVTTPEAINHGNLGKRLSPRSIVVNPYTWEGVLTRVDEILKECPGETWADQAELLSKHFHWEYEGYTPHTSP